MSDELAVMERERDRARTERDQALAERDKLSFDVSGYSNLLETRTNQRDEALAEVKAALAGTWNAIYFEVYAKRAVDAESDLAAAREELEAVKAELRIVIEQREAWKHECVGARNDLAATESDLAAAREALREIMQAANFQGEYANVSFSAARDAMVVIARSALAEGESDG